MEDLERYLDALRQSDILIRKLIDMLEEDKKEIYRGLSGEAESLYKKQCDQVIDEIRKIQKKVRVLYSESSAG